MSAREAHLGDTRDMQADSVAGIDIHPRLSLLSNQLGKSTAPTPTREAESAAHEAKSSALSSAQLAALLTQNARFGKKLQLAAVWSMKPVDGGQMYYSASGKNDELSTQRTLHVFVFFCFLFAFFLFSFFFFFLFSFFSFFFMSSSSTALICPLLWFPAGDAEVLRVAAFGLAAAKGADLETFVSAGYNVVIFAQHVMAYDETSRKYDERQCDPRPWKHLRDAVSPMQKPSRFVLCINACRFTSHMHCLHMFLSRYIIFNIFIYLHISQAGCDECICDVSEAGGQEV